MAKAKKDVFVNRALQRITMSAANTLTLQQVNFAVGIFQGVAIVLHRIKYYVGSTAWRETSGSTDSFQVGMTVSGQLADIAMTQAEVVDMHEITGVAAGTPANLLLPVLPILSDLTGLPGSGLLVAANPIYVAADSSGLTTAFTVDVEILFTFIELSDADYIELIQSRVQANI